MTLIADLEAFTLPEAGKFLFVTVALPSDVAEADSWIEQITALVSKYGKQLSIFAAVPTSDLITVRIFLSSFFFHCALFSPLSFLFPSPALPRSPRAPQGGPECVRCQHWQPLPGVHLLLGRCLDGHRRLPANPLHPHRRVDVPQRPPDSHQVREGRVDLHLSFLFFFFHFFFSFFSFFFSF